MSSKDALLGVLVVALTIFGFSSNAVAYDNWVIGYVIDNNVNCRDQPNLDSNIQRELNFGESVSLLVDYQENSYQKVVTEDGLRCWAHEDYLSQTEPIAQADKPILEIPIDMPVGEYVSETATGPSKHISEYEVVYAQPHQETNSGTVTGLPNTGGSERAPFVNGRVIGLAVSVLLIMAAAAVIATRRDNRQQATTTEEWGDFSSPQHGVTPPGSFK